MKFKFRGVWYNFENFYGVNVERISNEFFKSKVKLGFSPRLEDLLEYQNIEKDLDEDEYSFLDSMCRGVSYVNTFPRRPLKKVIDNYPNIEKIFHVQGYKYPKKQVSIRLEEYKIEFLKSEFRSSEFAPTVFKLFDYYVKHEGKKEILQDFQRLDYEKSYQNEIYHFLKKND